MDALPPALDPRLRARALAGAAWVREQHQAGRRILVVHHLDADGVTAGAIAAEALARANVLHATQVVRSLDDVHVRLVHDAAPTALWFCDLGSTAYMHFPQPKLVCDHHQLVRDGHEESFPHVNPLLDGIPGETISGAGCAFLVAAAMDAANADLVVPALVGAAGDRQDRPFEGTNQLLVRLAVGRGLADAAMDLSFFGPETRPLRQFLARGDVRVPGVAGDPRGAEALLLELGLPADTTWSALSPDERLRVRSALATRLLDCGLAAEVPGLWREVVRLAREPPGPTRELQEFATLLNSTARYGRPEVGLAVARGDRAAAYQEALALLVDHRKHLVGSLGHLAAAGVRDGVALQWVDVEDRVRDTVLGIVCGMALGGDMGLRQDRPIVGFAWTPDGRTKVSTRLPALAEARFDLAPAVRAAAEAVGGQGGGHRGAAGATIGRGDRDRFLAELDRLLAAQVGLALPAPAPTPAAPAQMLVRSSGAQTRFAL
ncbi:MAG: single-stranded-DNA-specific exonuclease [Thermoplasmata archaeon]|nr:single-stranded-DNA-specific exonuclease [Thermoplasmata archaeon]